MVYGQRQLWIGLAADSAAQVHAAQNAVKSMGNVLYTIHKPTFSDQTAGWGWPGASESQNGA